MQTHTNHDNNSPKDMYSLNGGSAICNVHVILRACYMGGPFLSSNSLVMNHESQTCIDKKSGYDLLNPPQITRSITKPNPRFGPELKKLQKCVIANIKDLFPRTHVELDSTVISEPCPIAAVRTD